MYINVVGVRLASLEAGEKDDVEFQKWKEEMIMVGSQEGRIREQRTAFFIHY